MTETGISRRGAIGATMFAAGGLMVPLSACGRSETKSETKPAASPRAAAVQHKTVNVNGPCTGVAFAAFPCNLSHRVSPL